MDNNNFNNNLNSLGVGNNNSLNNSNMAAGNNNYNQFSNNSNVSQFGNNGILQQNQYNDNLNANSAFLANQNNNVNSMAQNSFQNVGYINQVNQNNNTISDDDLLKAFIGKNYDKITTRRFNFAGFFFSGFYLFYRKMFLYGIVFFSINLIVLNLINNYIVNMLVFLAIGFFVNKVYLSFAKKKIEKIKIQNQGKSLNELINICSNSGGVSVGKVFLGFFVEVCIVSIVMLIIPIIGLSDKNILNFGNAKNNLSIGDATLVEDVVINGYSCSGTKCNIAILNSGNYMEYAFDANNLDLFKILNNYSDYIDVDIYYKDGNEKTIVDYKLYLKSNNEEIVDVTNEDELRGKIGLFTLGTHTDLFTLKKIGGLGGGVKDDESYFYASYTFVDSKNNQYEMKYVIPDNEKELDLVVGSKYELTINVVKDTFDYEIFIKSVK